MKIYLDNASTTKPDPRVLAKMQKYLTSDYGNPSSINAFGESASQALREARSQVAKILNAPEEGIIFNSGATESNNFIIQGLASAHQDSKRNKIIVSEIEHPCILAIAKKLAREGWQIEYLPVNNDGLVELKSLKAIIDKKTLLVSVMAINNEIGTVQNIKALAEIAHQFGAYFHTDAAQAVPYLKLDVKKMGIDFLSLSAHKFHGPRGIGLAYINREVKIKPLLLGGGQEFNLRSGTHNLPAIIGLSEALKLAYQERAGYLKRVKTLREHLWRNLKSEIPGIKINGSTTKRSEANLNVMFGYVEGEAILIDLSHKGISVSTGSACSATNLNASHVLKAIGLDKHFLNSNIRFSLSKYTTKVEIDKTIDAVKNTVARLRSFSPVNNLTNH